MPTLAIVSPDDRPVFEATFPQAFAGKHVVVEQLVLHSSLDMVDEKVCFLLWPYQYSSYHCVESTSELTSWLLNLTTTQCYQDVGYERYVSESR